jgi:hypothetical protein
MMYHDKWGNEDKNNKNNPKAPKNIRLNALRRGYTHQVSNPDPLVEP